LNAVPGLYHAAAEDAATLAPETSSGSTGAGGYGFWATVGGAVGAYVDEQTRS
jgi:hypothetical protein